MRYKKLIWTLFVSILLGIGWHLLFSYQSKSDIEIANILGISEAEIESFDYSDSWNLQDYDVVEKYKLSDNTIHRFLSSSSFVLYDKEYELDSLVWEKTNWSKTPIDSMIYELPYEMVFNVTRDNPQRNKWILEARESLNSLGGYYSFYYKRKGNAIEFLVLDIRKRILYIIALKI